ncbi:hypothetical protein FOZ60_001602 [Perkinsus olseni]|uniref:N-acetyltransferase domain-containing protein n=1 Tax=Perkinsus olseni TaxID=32597 RepID=A0A7J6P052_PEROL|nr:hypothetical protein FOZ60_001602 [Perkinsus olseni]
MTVNSLGRLFCIASALFPSAVFGLTIHLREGPLISNASELEYRLANSSDELTIGKSDQNAAVFVAVYPEKKVVVGSVEFGRIAGTDHVYIPWVRVRDGWRGRGIATEMLKRFIELIGNAKPRVKWIYMDVSYENAAAIGAYRNAGFDIYDGDGEHTHAAYIVPWVSKSTEDDEDDGIIPVISEPLQW